MRTGPIPYFLLGGLVAVLIGVALLATTSSQISERKDEVARLKSEDAVAASEASRLAAYVQFQSLHEQRLQTIASLADSRFDWERVMRELSLILPHDVWLTSLSASASSSSGGSGGGGEGGALRGAIAGPALQLSGCGKGQESVAGFVTALKDIDGVTRVGVESSELPGKEEGAGGGGGGEGGGGECRTRSFIAKFQVVVAFDAAPVPPAEGEGAPAAPAETAEATASETESSESESSEGS
jgi:Tfp pilus assembly protein PilN